VVAVQPVEEIAADLAHEVENEVATEAADVEGVEDPDAEATRAKRRNGSL